MRYNLLKDLEVKGDPTDWFQAVPEAHGISGKAAAHYFSSILRAPVAWMDAPLDVVDVPEAFGAEPHETPEGELPTYRGMLRDLGRIIGESGLLGAEGSPEDPFGEYELTPEVMQEILPLAVELAAYPAGVRAIQAGATGMVWGAEELVAAAARPLSRAATGVGEGFRKAMLPRRLAATQERLGALGEEAVAGAEWFVDVGEAQKLAMLDEAEKNIGYTLDWMEGTLAAEEDMAMSMAIEGSPTTPRLSGPGGPTAEGPAAGLDKLGPGAGVRIEGRIEAGYPPKGPASTAQVLESLSEGVPAQELDPLDYMGSVTAERLRRANALKRAEIKHATAVLRVRADAKERAVLNEIEAAGLPIDDPYNPALEVSPDKFDRVDRAVQELKAELPPKLQTEIHERVLPEMTADLRYTTEGQALKRRQSMAVALNEGLPKAEHITAEEILNANKDPNLREKLTNLMVRRMHNRPWYKNKAQGYADVTLLMRMGSSGLGAVTGAAVDEENRLRGAVIGAVAGFMMAEMLRLTPKVVRKLSALGEEGALVTDRPRWLKASKEKVVQEAEIAGAEPMRQPEHPRAEAKARGMRRQHQKDIYGKGITSGMTRDEVRAWATNTYGKGLSQMTEAEMAVANQDMTRRVALSRIYPEYQIDEAVKVREVEDLAMELYGTKATKRIDRAIRKTVGAKRDLRELDMEQLTSVLEILPKRFLGGRGFGALVRQPLAVEDVMNRMGTWGKYITRQVRRERLQTEYLWSKWTTPLLEDVKNLNEAQMQEVVAALHPLEVNGRQIVIPQDEKLAQLAVRIRQTLNEVGELRKGIGDPIRLANGGEVPFELMQDYYPLHIPPDELTASIQIKRRILEHLIESGQATGASEALDIYNNFINKSITNRFGNLDYAREAWIEPEKFDLVKDLSRYYYGAAKRVSRHQHYGRATGTDLPEKMAMWLDRMKQDVGIDEFNYAHKAMTKHFKTDAVDDAMSDMLKRVRSFETVAHMGLASIMNASEPVHTAVYSGFRNFARGFSRAIRSTSAMDARELVARNAAAVGSTLRDLIGEAGGAGSLTSKFLRMTGFTGIEKWNRRLASHVGIQYIESVVSKLAKNPNSPRLRGMLDELLINADDVLRHGLTEEQMIKGAMELANKTQKRTGVIDMPLFMSHPVGRIFTMFKTFSYGAARLMTRDFLLAAHRNPERLLRLLVAFPIVGELVGDVRNLATGKIRETEGLARLAENFAYVGTLGIFYDFLRSASFGEAGVTAFMVGPVGSDIASLLSGSHDWLMEGKGRKLQKFGLRALPPPATLLRGPEVQKKLFGKEFFPPSTKTWQIP